MGGVTQSVQFLHRLTQEERQRVQGQENALSALEAVAVGVDIYSDLVKELEILERHAMDDMSKPYMVCYGEREFYQRALAYYGDLV